MASKKTKGKKTYAWEKWYFGEALLNTKTGETIRFLAYNKDGSVQVGEIACMTPRKESMAPADLVRPSMQDDAQWWAEVKERGNSMPDYMKK